MTSGFSGATGRGVRVAIIDSGVNPDHPHVAGIAGGTEFTGGAKGLYLDYIGHGTAVAGAICEKAPAAELFAVKVFDRALITRAERILEALEWCVENGMHVVNLSLGTTNSRHRARFEQVVARAGGSGVILVSASQCLPGCLPGVVGVQPDPTCPREEYRARGGCFYASPYPRPVPGVPPERNLNGASFAVANMSGFVARAWEICGGTFTGICEFLIHRQTSEQPGSTYSPVEGLK
jgi:hypothetical protein